MGQYQLQLYYPLKYTVVYGKSLYLRSFTDGSNCVPELICDFLKNRTKSHEEVLSDPHLIKESRLIKQIVDDIWKDAEIGDLRLKEINFNGSSVLKLIRAHINSRRNSREFELQEVGYGNLARLMKEVLDNIYEN